MKLYIVEGLDGCGKDYLINKMLEYDEELVLIPDNCHHIQNFNNLIYERTLNKDRSVYSLIEYALMRRIEEAYSSGASRAIVSRLSASTYAYQAYASGLYPNDFFAMNTKIKEYAEFFGVRLKYIFRDIGTELSKKRVCLTDSMDEFFMSNAEKINNGYKEFFEKFSEEFVYRLEEEDLTDSDIKQLVYKIQQSPVEV